MNTTKSIIAVAVALAVGLVIGYFVFHSSVPQNLVGAVGVKLAENYDPYIKYNGGYNSNLPIQTNGTLQVGASGSVIHNEIFGTCFYQAYATTIAASSTAFVDCQSTAATGGITNANDVPLPGVLFGDVVDIQQSTTTAGTTLGGLDVIGASASSTPGYIQITLQNNTGTTFTWPTTGTATGTAGYQSYR